MHGIFARQISSGGGAPPPPVAPLVSITPNDTTYAAGTTSDTISFSSSAGTGTLAATKLRHRMDAGAWTTVLALSGTRVVYPTLSPGTTLYVEAQNAAGVTQATANATYIVSPTPPPPPPPPPPGGGGAGSGGSSLP